MEEYSKLGEPRQATTLFNSGLPLASHKPVKMLPPAYAKQAIGAWERDSRLPLPLLLPAGTLLLLLYIL